MKIKEEDKKNEIRELEGDKKLLYEILHSYAEETTRLKLLLKGSQTEVKKVVQAKKTEFDLTIQCDSLLSIKNEGWPVKFANKYQATDEEYEKLKSINCNTVAVLGSKGTGKTFFISHIANTIFESSLNYHKAISIKFPSDSKSICYIDSNFTDFPYIREDNQDSYKNHIFTEDFLRSFVISEANCIFYMVDIINGTNQKMIEAIKTKVGSLLTGNKKIFFIHNLQLLTTIDEVNQYYNAVLKKIFKLTEKIIGNDNKESQSISNENYYFTESDSRYVHYIIGRKETVVGALYNDKTFKHILSHIATLSKPQKFNIIEDFTNYFESNSNIYFSSPQSGRISIRLLNKKCFVLNQNEELVLSEKKLNELGTQLMKADAFNPHYNVTKDTKTQKLNISINIPSDNVDLKVDKKIVGENIWFKITGRYEHDFGASKGIEISNTVPKGNFEVNFPVPFALCNIKDYKYAQTVKNGFLLIQYNCIRDSISHKISIDKDSIEDEVADSEPSELIEFNDEENYN